MRILEILSGLAVLLFALFFIHVMHHFYTHSPDHNLIFWAGMLTAVALWILSIIGGCLLLRRSR